MITCLGKTLFIRFTASAFRKLLSIYVFSYFPVGFEGRMLDLILSVPYLFTSITTVQRFQMFSVCRYAIFLQAICKSV